LEILTYWGPIATFLKKLAYGVAWLATFSERLIVVYLEIVSFSSEIVTFCRNIYFSPAIAAFSRDTWLFIRNS
jgi:hypothetical protein